MVFRLALWKGKVVEGFCSHFEDFDICGDLYSGHSCMYISSYDHLANII